MNGKWILAVAAIASSPSSFALAGEVPSYFDQRVPAPRDALELSVAYGYTQAFGMLRGGVAMPDIMQGGLAVDLGTAYRIDPRWAVGVTGQYQEFGAKRSAFARGLATGAAASYHFLPYLRRDPWVQLGVGYRLLWEIRPDTPTILSHGFQLAKLTAGIDLRSDKNVAVSAVLGADLDVFLWRVDDDVSRPIDDPRWSTFVYAGVQGRFDIAGSFEYEDRRTGAMR